MSATSAPTSTSTSTSPTSARRAPRRWARSALTVALAGAVALIAAGCTTTSAPTAEAGPLPGIDGESVAVGFTVVDLGQLADTIGFTQVDYGGVETLTKGITAIVDHINANGGMGGRQVRPVIQSYLGSTDSPAQAQALCSAFTQDEQVAAVVMDGMLQTNALPCYRAANTLVLDETLVAHDQQQFEANSPYLWSPTHPEYAGFMQAQLEAMNAAGFFAGSSGVLVMAGDDEVSRRVTTTVVQPYLASAGVTSSRVGYVDSTDIGTLSDTATATINAGKSSGLDRVLVVGGARIEPFALADSSARGYRSRWSISTYDNPNFTENNPRTIIPALRVGMTGLGYQPAQDVRADQAPPFPDPANPNQVLCTQIVNAAGATPPLNQRPNWTKVLQYCDGALFLKAALDGLAGEGAVTGERFRTAVDGIGSTYRSSLTISSSWTPGTYAGTNGARPLAWNQTCLCFEYVGEVVTFPTGGTGIPAGDPPAAGVPTTGASATAVPAPSAPVPSAPVPSAPAPSAPAPSVSPGAG